VSEKVVSSKEFSLFNYSDQMKAIMRNFAELIISDSITEFDANDFS